MERFRYIVPIHVNKQIAGAPVITKLEMIGLSNADGVFVDGMVVTSNLKNVHTATGWEYGNSAVLSAGSTAFSILRNDIPNSPLTFILSNPQVDAWSEMLIFVFGD